MPLHTLPDHPQRYELSNELHARPFPELAAPCMAAFLTIKAPKNAAERDRGADYAHLLALLDRHGVAHPPPGANHYAGPLGRAFLKWEMHTEFVTYSLYVDGLEEGGFSGASFDLFPQDWLAKAPGALLSSALIRFETAPDLAAREALLNTKAQHWFVPESLAVANVLDGEATIAADFRLDAHGHVRFLVLADPGIGPRRLGRIAQRLLEIEMYKTASLLTLPVARHVAGRVAALDRDLTQVVQAMSASDGDDSATLDQLLRMAAEIETLLSSSAFRFGAAGAYAAIVNQRIEALRETRFGGRQTFGEFMMHRYDPAMRTCDSALARLQDLSARAERAANLLRTRVDVAAERHNSAVLHSMDRRADLQLRLQETVEGLSVVAIGYYAVSLLGYVLAPIAKLAHVDKLWLQAGATPLMLLIVWYFVRAIRRTAAKKRAEE